MGRSTLLLVLAAVVGGSYLSYNVLRTQTETTGRRSNAQANVLARQLAESGQAIAISSITVLDGFENNGVFKSDRDYNGGKIHFEEFEDGLTATSPLGERVAIQVSGEYGGARHRLSSVYEFDPMEFPGPLWIDVPYAAASVHPSASFSGGKFKYEPQVDPGKYNDLDIADMGLSLNEIKTALNGTNINGTGASVPAWDVAGTSDDGLGRTADLGDGVSSADDLYYQVSNAIDTAEGDVVIAGAYTVSGTETYGTPQTITQFTGDVTVPSGAKLNGSGALIVEGDLVVEGQMRWAGLVIVRSTEQALRVELGDTRVEGAFVISQEAFPPGGHMDVTVFREPTGGNTAPYGRRAAGPGALRASPWSVTTPWPFWQHTHKFDYPAAGAADYAARSDREIRFVDKGAGDPQESYTGLRELLNHLGSQSVYVEFDNVHNGGHAIVEMEVDGFDAVERGVSMGFTDTALAGGSKRRSRAFEADELERLVVRPQSLRSLRKLWDPNGVCAGAAPAEWPICVGYDRGDREGALTLRVRRAGSNAMLYESAVYWHMQAGAEHDDYNADRAAWQASVGSGATTFGTTFSASASTRVTYDLAPIAALAEKVGFAGNRVIHISTESKLVEAQQMAGGATGGTAGAASGTTGGGTTGGGTTGGGTTGGGTTGGGTPTSGPGGTAPSPGSSPPTGGGTTGGGTTGGGTTGGTTGGSGGTTTVAVCYNRAIIQIDSADLARYLAMGAHSGYCDGHTTTHAIDLPTDMPVLSAPTDPTTVVKVCRPDGGTMTGSWNEVEMMYQDVEAYRSTQPLAVYGACSDHGL